ncbi:hypothetical protein ACTUSQ_01445 [Pantoea ananatis]|uniref:hypothetical protein n=1 Tax=Pantoea ananas TaxID=553 RepID=UPI001E38DCB0|nr:hypothetical protein [Pantoea ananatis]
MNKIFLVFIFSLTMVGCAKKVDPALQAEVMKPLICKDEKQCDTYWKRSQFWIANNSSWKIQTATDTLISTYNPAPYSPLLAYQASKMPHDDGSSQIFIKPYCDNMFGCQPDIYQAVVAFKSFVRNGS